MGLLAGCRPPAYGSDLDPARWPGPDGLGVSSGWEYLVHSRPREGAAPIAYFYFVDHGCQLIPGELHFWPWRRPKLPADLGPEDIAYLEQRWAGNIEPTVDGFAPVQVSERGTALELPIGTWRIQASPTVVDRAWPAYADTRLFLELTVDPEYDVLVLMHHAVPPRARSHDAYERRLARRADRYSWRCYAGENLTPRFEAQLEDAERP